MPCFMSAKKCCTSLVSNSHFRLRAAIPAEFFRPRSAGCICLLHLIPFLLQVSREKQIYNEFLQGAFLRKTKGGEEGRGELHKTSSGKLLLQLPSHLQSLPLQQSSWEVPPSERGGHSTLSACVTLLWFSQAVPLCPACCQACLLRGHGHNSPTPATLHPNNTTMQLVLTLSCQNLFKGLQISQLIQN